MTTALEFLNIKSDENINNKNVVKEDPTTGMDQLQTRLIEAAAHKGVTKL
jgi:predicted lipase